MNYNNFHTAELLLFCKKHNISSLSVFGSTARGEATDKSDIDLLVGFSRPVSLLQMVALERELSMLLGRKVDLNTKASLSPYLRNRILKECKIIYAS